MLFKLIEQNNEKGFEETIDTELVIKNSVKKSIE